MKPRMPFANATPNATSEPYSHVGRIFPEAAETGVGNLNFRYTRIYLNALAVMFPLDTRW